MNKSKIVFTYIIFTLFFIIIIIRYAFLQIIGHNQLLQQSINNYSSILTILPVRGTILDRNNEILANNKISYAIGILTKNYKKNINIFEDLNSYINITNIDKIKFKKQLNKAKNYDLIIIKDDLNEREIANFTSHNYLFPEVVIFARTKRDYPYNELYAHSIGYVGKVSPSDLKKINSKRYLNNDYIGKTGLEGYYESLLRGEIGKKVIQTDSLGNELGLINNIPAKNGLNIQITIDNNLQNLAYSLLENYSGAIVALDPQNGDVLAFVSNPSYNPNWFIDGINTEEWYDISNDNQKPLLNRASQSSYPPGSTFKPFIGLIALDMGFRNQNSQYYDHGYFIAPGSNHKFRDNDHPNGLGYINMKTAIAMSSDTFFYKLAYDMGINNINKGLSIFGFGKKTGIDLPTEASGLLPSKEWKARRFAKDNYQKNWLPADSITIGIGQGFNHYTPLQMAYFTSIIANNGTAIPPHFLKAIIPDDKNNIHQYTPKLYNLNINQNNLNYIKQSMQLVVTNGTAKGISYGLKYSMAGKTGTAQVVSTIKNGRAQKFTGHKYKDHSWFIAFAPVDKPKIAIAIIVENGGFGASVAAPIARKLFDAYLLKINPSTLKNTENVY
jgi:penicillin-binding protein 2